ncbi:hypothetical protein V6N12_019540 [Hibiscus sabdariffa]|uniref:C-JID domain-containing protein n=1 Tax=Hibiscus sabdariffa TaxID=183260 RepID=A0ABR2BMU8_9ROSI
MTQIDNLQLCSTVFEKMHNLKYIHFGVPWHLRDVWEEKLLAGGVENIFLPEVLRYLSWDYYPFRSLSSFNPKNLVILKLYYGNIEELWNEDDHLEFVNLRRIDLSYCKNLRKIPILLRAIKLEKLHLEGCGSLIELPCLDHLSSLYQFWYLKKCYNLNKFPELPNHMVLLNMEKTGIEEVPDSIEHLVELETLCLRNSRVKYVSSNISKLEFLHHLDLSYCPITELPEIPRRLTELYLSGTQIVDVTLSSHSLKNLQYLDMTNSSIQKLQCNISGSIEIPILRSKVLGSLVMAHCERLKLLSELPPYLGLLDAHGCTSLENVSFMDQNLYRYHSSVEGDDDDAYDVFFLLFSNCFSLNQDSVDNIEANTILNIGSLAKTWASIYDSDCATECIPRLVCCFPGNRISANKFEHRTVNSSINLEVDSNGCSRSRFLGFAVCLVADLTPCHDFFKLKYICEYQLTAAGGGGYKDFQIELYYSLKEESDRECKGDHVLILSSIEMVTKDENYVEASFKFYIRSYENSVDETEFDDIEVKKCGVHVFYVDAESDSYSGWTSNDEARDSLSSTESSNSDELSNDESNRNLDSQVHAGADTEMRHGGKRRLSCDAEEGDGEPKRLK